jgi:hypothetical protein
LFQEFVYQTRESWSRARRVVAKAEHLEKGENQAPKGRYDGTAYRYTLVREQHDLLHTLAQEFPDAVFYVLLFYATHTKLQRDVPNLMLDTWFLPIAPMATPQVFGAKNTKVVRCRAGVAVVNPEYHLDRSSDLKVTPVTAGVPSRNFAAWYIRFRMRHAQKAERRKPTNPWLVGWFVDCASRSSSRSFRPQV